MKSLVIALLLLAPALFAQSALDPETVLVTYHVKSGQQSQIESILNKQWSALRKLDVVVDQPHLILRGVEDGGKPVYVEIFTWRTADSADHLPAEVQEVWKEMRQSTEQRLGRPGIDVHPMTPLGTGK